MRTARYSHHRHQQHKLIIVTQCHGHKLPASSGEADGEHGAQTYSGIARNFHLGPIAQGARGTEVPSGVQGQSPSRGLGES